MRVRSISTGVAGSPYYTNLFFGGTADATTAQAAADAVESFWTDLAAWMANDVTTVVESAVAVLDEASGQPINVLTTSTTPVVGTNTGEILPLATQGLIRWNTGQFLNGRQVIGRTFIPVPTETSSLDGQPTAAYLTGIGTAGDSLLGAAGATFVIYSRTGAADYAAVEAVPWTKWAVLRSRRD